MREDEKKKEGVLSYRNIYNQRIDPKDVLWQVPANWNPS